MRTRGAAYGVTHTDFALVYSAVGLHLKSRRRGRPPVDLALLAPALETVALAQDAVISREGDRVGYVLFPHSGAISLMVDFADGATVATAIVGREGALGTLSAFGPAPLGAYCAIVRAEGIGSRIPASQFRTAFSRSPAIRHAIQAHVRAMLVQLQRGGACNALHPVQARMARWLLHIRDRIDDNVLPLTEALSQILGVRRTTVTLLMRNLRASGAIRSERRGHIETDRLKLAAAACECHRTMRREVEEIFSMNAARSCVTVPTNGTGRSG